MNERENVTTLRVSFSECWLTLNTNLGEGDVFLDIEVDLRTNQLEDEEDAEVAPQELLDLIDRQEMRS